MKCRRRCRRSKPATATTGQAIEAQTIRDLPLATQNFQQLLTLSGGDAERTERVRAAGPRQRPHSVNGQREDNNNYLIEGISATDYNVAELTNMPLPNPDVVQEFKVQTTLYDATQGRNGGGNINAILKSGTKNFHGSLFEFFRNADLNANEYFLNRARCAGTAAAAARSSRIFSAEASAGRSGRTARADTSSSTIRARASAAAFRRERSSAPRCPCFPA